MRYSDVDKMEKNKLCKCHPLGSQRILAGKTAPPNCTGHKIMKAKLYFHIKLLVSVAQWLGRRSSTGGLSLIYT